MQQIGLEGAMKQVFGLSLVLFSISFSLSAVTTDRDGFTLVDLPRNAKRWYVSERGKPAHSGLSPDAPTTLSKALALAEPSDHILLRRGSEFLIGTVIIFKTSGRSAEQPTVIGAYGPLSEPRPRLLVRSKIKRGPDGKVSRESVFGDGIRLGDDKSGVQNILIQSLAIIHDSRDPESPNFMKVATKTMKDKSGPAGILSRGLVSRNVTIEDCYIRFFSAGVSLQLSDSFRFYRNLILDNYDTGGTRRWFLSINNLRGPH